MRLPAIFIFMRIGGLLKFSLIDYPGKLAAVIFTQGCNFRCPYCHNPELVRPLDYQESLDNKDVLNFLERRQGKLEGVVVSGGEATLQPDLESFLRQLKVMGYAVKLDTNGSRPHILRTLLKNKLLDHVAMDVKSSLVRYSQFCGISINPALIQESLDLLLTASIPVTFRTTLVRALDGAKDLPQIYALLAGAQFYRLQRSRLGNAWLDEDLRNQEGVGYEDEELHGFKQEWEIG